MATNTISGSLHLFDLPDDLLLEILALLPGVSVVLSCRRVCHKMYILSQERHLWIRLFNRTKYMLRQPFEWKQSWTLDSEKSICRAEMLEGIWSNTGALGTAPRFSRKALNNKFLHGLPVAIMGDFIVFWQTDYHNCHHRLTWVSANDWNGPIVYRFNAESSYRTHTAKYMDSETGIFYLAFPADIGLELAGFQIDRRTGQPHEIARFALPAGCKCIYTKELENCFLCCYNCDRTDDGSTIEVNVVDLRRGMLFPFVLPHLASFFPGDRHHTQSSRVFATETHLIYACATRRTAFIVCERPTNDQGIQLLGNDATLTTREATPLNPILIKRLPFELHRLWVMPRSATSFVIVGIRHIDFSSPFKAVVIHTFFVSFAEGKTSFKEVGSLTIPGRLNKCFLQSPPPTSRYALGIISTLQLVGDCVVEETSTSIFKRENIALRIDLPDPQQDQEAGNQYRMSMTRIQLAPAVDEEREEAEFQCFDHFSGRAALFASPHDRLKLPAGVVLDYLSGDHLKFY